MVLPKVNSLKIKKVAVVLSLIGILLSFHSVFAQSNPPRKIKGLFSGKPSIIGTELPDEAFETMTVYRIRPEFLDIAWINWQWLKDQNIDVPAQGMTPEFKAEILDEIGWGIPGENDPEGMFDRSQSKQIWVGYYGGNHMGANSGDGRATTAGTWITTQMKANGKTVMSTATTADHTDGVSTLRDISTEAIGELAHHEYPHDAIRPILLLFRRGDKKEFYLHSPMGMAWRVFPKRLAQFEIAPGQKEVINGRRVPTEKELKRISKVQEYLPFNLPKPMGYHSTGNIIADVHEGSLEYARRIAEQTALQFGLLIQQGSNSASNRGLNGEVLDLATFTALPQRFKFKLLPPDAAFMTTYAMLKNQILRPFEDIRETTLNEAIKKGIPTVEEFKVAFNMAYKRAAREQLLLQVGTPDDLIGELLGARIEAKLLADYLMEIAMSGTDKTYRILGLFKQIKKPVDYDLNLILPKLAGVASPNAANLSAAVARELDDLEVRTKLVDLYIDYLKASQEVAQTHQISPTALRTAMLEQSTLRSTPMSDLFYIDFHAKNFFKIRSAASHADFAPYQEFLDQAIDRSRRTFKDHAPFEFVLAETNDVTHATKVRKVFNLKSNAYELVVRIQKAGEEGHFFGQTIHWNELTLSRLMNGDTIASGPSPMTKSLDDKVYLEFRAPIAGNPSSLRFEIVAPSGNSWRPGVSGAVTFTGLIPHASLTETGADLTVLPLKETIQFDPKKVDYLPIVSGKQYLVIPQALNAGRTDANTYQAKVPEVMKLGLAYIALVETARDGAHAPIRGTQYLDAGKVKNAYSIEIPSRLGNDSSLGFVERSIIQRIEQGHLQDLVNGEAWSLHSGITDATQMAEDLSRRFNVTREEASACIHNMMTAKMPSRSEIPANKSMDQWVPFWNWEKAPYVSKAKAKALQTLTQGFIRTVASWTKPRSDDLAKLMQTWVQVSNLRSDLSTLLAKIPEREWPTVDRSFAQLTGPVDVNAFDTGVEYTANFPVLSKNQLNPKNEWLYSYYNPSPAEREEILRQTAYTLSRELNDGVALPIRKATGGHGHGLSVNFKVDDKQGRVWRVEWDGIARSYDEEGDLVDDSARSGKVEIVTPKMVSTEASRKAVFNTFEKMNLHPNIFGGGHITFDLQPFAGHPKAMARMLVALHKYRGIISLMFQDLRRIKSAAPIEVSSKLQQGLEKFTGSEEDLKKLLYNERYFNSRVGRKTRYSQLNLISYFQDVIPEEMLTSDYNIKKDPWRRQFGVDPQIQKAELRLFDAPANAEEAANQLRLVRALLNKAFNETDPLQGIQEVFYEKYLNQPELAAKEVQALCADLHLDPEPYQQYATRGVNRVQDLIKKGHSIVLFDILSENADQRGLFDGWGRAVAERTGENRIASAGREWRDKGSLAERFRLYQLERVRAAADAERARLDVSQLPGVITVKESCEDVFLNQEQRHATHL